MRRWRNDDCERLEILMEQEGIEETFGNSLEENIVLAVRSLSNENLNFGLLITIEGLGT